MHIKMISHSDYYAINTSTVEIQARRVHHCFRWSGEKLSRAGRT